MAERAEYCCDGSSPDDIVISGIAGRFPESYNVGELSEGLYNKKTFMLPSEERWEKGTLNLPYTETGLIKDIDKFDNEFFRMPGCIARSMEADQRKLMEVCYEAVADAGYDPDHLRGRKISIYCASSNTDGKDISIRGLTDYDIYTGIGALKCLRANRCSYVLDFRGPSFVVDSACSSSAIALDIAVKDLKSGRCEAAVVSGCQIILNPEINYGYMWSGILSKSGTCCPFDAKADGMIRTEAVAAFFIQKASSARRIYAKILHSKVISAGYVPEGVYVPSVRAEVALFKETFAEAKMDPLEIEYIEAHGTGTAVGDPVEISAISEVFCKNREKPLLIGTMKSNTGHPEAPAGLCGIIKVILAFETGMIAPNLNFETPNPNCQALVDGRIKIVTDTTPFPGNKTAVNCFGFGGAICQILLQRNEYVKAKDENRKIPQLGLYSATTEEGVKYAFDYLFKEKPEREFFGLLHNLAASSPVYKPYRGYVILNDPPISEVQQTSSDKREVWYIVTGMGCQYPGMACDLMQLDVFANSMRRSAEVLKPYGIDLLELIQPNKDHLLQKRRITPAFVAICAIQIALVDVLTELGIVPDGIIGHSTGELVCAYADGCCTAEETMLSALWRGKAVEASDLPDGAMAAVGLTWEEAKKRCPENVYASCHNAQDSVTISGLTGPLEQFVETLKSENVFARVVDAYGYGFHSPLVRSAAPALKSALEKVLLNPKPRTKRWRSTSFPPEDWEKPEANIADANYFVSNLMSNVRFAEALACVPADAITIEIGPHFLLQAILKRVIGKNAAYVGLMKRNENNVNFLLSSIGKLYTLGLNPNVENLYPPMKYPVPRGTPVLSNLIKWNHKVSWFVPKWTKGSGTISKFLIKTNGADEYLLDHCIEGRSLFPATGYVALAWEALARLLDKKMDELPIVIEDFKIHRATILSAADSKTLSVSILNVSGDFEIVEGGTVVSSGRIIVSQDLDLSIPDSVEQNAAKMISGNEMYAELKISGYEYGPAFRCLEAVDIEGTGGLVRWTNKWIPYLDAHLLFFGLIHDNQQFALPTGALSFKIQPQKLRKYIEDHENAELTGLPVIYEKYSRICRSPGVEIEKLKLEAATHRVMADNLPLLEKYSFTPYFISCCLKDDAKRKCIDYINACNELAKKIAVSFGKGKGGSDTSSTPDAQTAADQSPPKDEDHVLLEILTKISCLSPNNDILSALNDLFGNYIENIGKDLLYRTVLNEDPLRVALEIVSENIPGRLTAVELSNEFPPILPTLTDVIRVCTRYKLKSTLLHPNPAALDQELLTQKGIEVTQIKSPESLRNVKDNDLIVSSFLFGDTEAFHSLVDSLVSMGRNGSFILLFHRVHVSPSEAFLFSLCDVELQTQTEADAERVFKEADLTLVSKICDSLGTTMYLLRCNIPPSPPHEDVVVNVKDGSYGEWVEQLKQSLLEVNNQETAKRIWLVAEDSPYNGIVGMMKCLRQEPGGENVRCVFTMRDGSSPSPPPFDLKNPFYADVLGKDLVMNIYQKGCWGSFRHWSMDIDLVEGKVEHSYLDCLKYGDLTSFKWIESPCKYNVGVDGKANELIHVVYSALNFKDVMLATGKISVGAARAELGNDTCVLGLEFSGITADGRRVMGAINNRAMATTIDRRPLFLIEVPDHWTLEDAATVPVVYGTSYYALIVRGQLSKGESVLIHSGTGGIGIAAIRIALSLGCEVFTTVGTNEKREYLKKLFPQIKEENIGCSRNTSFEHMIQQQTNGRGVDVVLNSLADDKLQASVRCLAKHGRFVEIGKYDLALDHKLGMSVFLEGTAFHGVFLDKLPDFSSEHGLNVRNLLMEGLNSGVVQPLDRTVFQSDEVEQAFRFMGSGKHMGKVLLKIRDEPVPLKVPEPLEKVAVKYTYFYRHKTYIIIGGLGGFGIELTKWLIQKGARNIVITSRFGVRTVYHELCMKRWKQSGANVTVSLLNVAKKDEARQLLEEASKIGPVGGIFNSAVVLKDAFMENQSAAYFEEACAPKAEATKYLDELSRALCPSLDIFVCFSSISCGKGNAGQTNYGYANSVMERVCEKRHKDGLHGLAVQWGIIGDVGVVHRQMGEDAMIAGVMAQRIKSCLETLDKFLQLQEPVVCSYVNADALKKKANPDDILMQLAKILGHKDPSELNMKRSFREIGIDSMVGVEIQQALECNYDITMSVKELQEMKIGDLKALVDSKGAKKPAVRAQKDAMAQEKSGKPQNLIPKVAIMPLNGVTGGMPMIFVHYSEQEAERLKVLTAELKQPCFALLCPKSTSLENIEAMAKSYLDVINKQFSHTPVHLVGYASATSLALEMSSLSHLLKDAPKIETLTVLDGSLPFTNGSAADLSDNQQQISDLTDFLRQFGNSDSTMVENYLELHSGEERFKSLAEFATSTFSLTTNKEEAVEAARRYVQVRNLLRSYQPKQKLKHDMLVIEATGKLLANDVSVVKSAFSKVCSGKVLIHRIPGGEDFLFDRETVPKVAELLNSVCGSKA